MICFDKNCRICECIEKNAKSYLGQFTFLKIFKILTLKSIKKNEIDLKNRLCVKYRSEFNSAMKSINNIVGI